MDNLDEIKGQDSVVKSGMCPLHEALFELLATYERALKILENDHFDCKNKEHCCFYREVQHEQKAVGGRSRLTVVH